MLARSVRLDVPEGDAAEGLGELQAAHPDVQIGSYPFFENKRLGTYIVLRSVDEAKLAAAENALWKFIAEEGFQLPPATAEPAFVHKANHWGENLRARWRFVLDRPAYEGHQGARNLIGVRARKATRHERHRFRGRLRLPMNAINHFWNSRAAIASPRRCIMPVWRRSRAIRR